MKKPGITITSLSLAALLALSNPIGLTHAYAAEGSDSVSYDITYILDESQATIEDNYTEEMMKKYRNVPDSQVVEIPEKVSYSVRSALNKKEGEEITVGDLRTIDRLFLSIYDDGEDIDMSWLNYCSNLQSLFITGDIVEHLDEVIGLDGVKMISLSSGFYEPLDLKHCGFLKHCPSLESISIVGLYNPEQVYQLKNVKHLSIDVGETHSIDFRKLDFLEELTLYGGPYDIAIYLSNDDIDYLESRGVKITFGHVDDTSLDQVREINDKLDEIIASLNIDENATDEEKIQAVLIYVLSTLEYDEEVSSQLEAGKRNDVDHDRFYQGGDLYAALEEDTQICGNFAALTSALLHRLGIKDYFIISENHAWNLVEVDGEYYYFDSTWLDGQTTYVPHEERTEETNGFTITISYDPAKSEEIILSGDPELIKELIWYKVNPADYLANPDEYDHGHAESHQAYNFPITIVEVKEDDKTPAVTASDENTVVSDVVSEEQANDEVIHSEEPVQADKSFAQKLFDVTIGNKVFRITGAVLIGLMSALGVAFSVHHIKEKKRLERMRRRRELDEMYGFGSSYYGSGSYDHDDSWTL